MEKIIQLCDICALYLETGDLTSVDALGGTIEARDLIAEDIMGGERELRRYASHIEIGGYRDVGPVGEACDCCGRSTVRVSEGKVCTDPVAVIGALADAWVARLQECPALLMNAVARRRVWRHELDFVEAEFDVRWPAFGDGSFDRWEIAAAYAYFRDAWASGRERRDLDRRFDRLSYDPGIGGPESDLMGGSGVGLYTLAVLVAEGYFSPADRRSL